MSAIDKHVLGTETKCNEINHYENVRSMISKNVTPLEAKTILGAKLTVQENLNLKQYYASLFNIENKPNKKLLLEYGCIMLVGLPASGKTTLSNLILTHFDTSVIHLNQDEIGRNGCYEVMCNYAKKQDKTIILDRCNLTIAERSDWIKTYRSLSSRPIICVHFDIVPEVCKMRVQSRKNHDMKNPYIIDDLAKKLQEPQTSEGFNLIEEISEDEDLTTLLGKFGIQYIPSYDGEIGLKKFVSTKHIVKLGESTDRHDKIFEGKDLTNFLKEYLIIEEKIDGANMGIFINEDNEIIIQNRSHFVSSKSDRQFEGLDKWKFQHENDIRQVLGNNKWIIYGEWVVIKHSIHYTRLPNKFVLFDIYDRTTNKFFSRNKIENLIRDTAFVQIRKITEGVFTLEQLINLARKTKSIYYDGIIEGIYARCFSDDDTVKERGKIVRDDFIQKKIPNQKKIHWRSQEFVKNIIPEDF